MAAEAEAARIRGQMAERGQTDGDVSITDLDDADVLERARADARARLRLVQ